MLGLDSVFRSPSAPRPLGTARETRRSLVPPGAVVLTLLVGACGGSEPNQAPAIPVIESPQANEVYSVRTPIPFLGRVTDPEDGSLVGERLRWTSSLDGALGIGGSFTRSDLSEGAHVITLTGTDSDGEISSASRSITVEDFAPGTPVIVSPGDGQEFGLEETIRFEGSATDPEDGELTGDALVWRSTVDGVLGSGNTLELAGLTAGRHGISLTATDSNGQMSQTAVPIRVLNLPPDDVTILSPADGSTYSTGMPVEFRGAATDPEDGPLTADALTWMSDVDGELGSGSPLVAEGLSEGVHVVTLVATDAAGMEASASIEIVVGPVFVETEALDDGRVGIDYDGSLTARGGVAPFTWALVSGVLPGGVSLHSGSGELTGMPQVKGTFDFTVQVTDSEGDRATSVLQLHVCDPVLDLAVGDVVVTDLPFGCGQVLARSGADYRVALMARQASEGPDALPGGLLLRAVAGTPGGMFPAAVRPTLRTIRAPFPDRGLDPAILELARATERLHLRLREEERHLVPNAPGGGQPSVLGPPLEAQGLPTPERAAQDTRTFWVREPGLNRVQVQATLRGENASLLYYEDDGVVTEGSRATDLEVQDVLDYYEAWGRPLIDEVFGGLGPEGTTQNFSDGGGAPLTLPADDLDQNGGRLIVFQIRPSYMPEGAAAYVSSCDRFPRPENYAAGPFICSGSNQAEITYISRPQSNFYLGSVVHEAKHVSSHGYALFADRGFNPSWIEEGTAEIAKEKSSRDAAGLVDGEEVLLTDIYPGNQLTAATYGMGVVHSRARAYLKAAPRSGLVGNPDPNPFGSTYYGASWLFHRFLVDAYGGGDEDAFVQALNTGGAGVDRIEEVTGRSLSQLFTDFLAAVAVEGEAGARAALARRLRSYDFADVARGFEGTWPYVLAPAGDAFETVDWEVPNTHYTSAGFIDFSGAGATWLRLDLLRSDGVELDPSDDVGMVIVRVR